MKQVEDRRAELLVRREKRREELERQKSLTLQSVGRMTSALVFPHPDREAPDVRRLCPNLETETTGTILLTPNERRVVGDRHDCYWLYVVTNRAAEATLQEPIKDPARFPWHEVSKVQHYWLEVNAMTRPLTVKEDSALYGDSTDNDAK